MELTKETKKIQRNLVSYCRNGIAENIPGLTSNRLQEYRRLVFSNIQDQLESAFPIAYATISEEKWEKLVVEFFKEHACTTTQIWKLGAEFHSFVSVNGYAEKLDLPYLTDLLRFEWEEIQMYSMEDIAYPKTEIKGELLSSTILLNPEHTLLHLAYPIHLENIQVALTKKGNYFVLIYRERESGKVQFLDISVWFAFLLEQIHLQQKTVAELIQEALTLFGEIDLQALKTNTLLFLEDLQQKEFIIGFKI